MASLRPAVMALALALVSVSTLVMGQTGWPSCNDTALAECNMERPDFTALCVTYPAYEACVTAASCNTSADFAVYADLADGCATYGSGSGMMGSGDMQDETIARPRVHTEMGNMVISVPSEGKDVRFTLGEHTVTVATLESLIFKVAERARKDRRELETRLDMALTRIATLEQAVAQNKIDGTAALNAQVSGLTNQIATAEANLDASIVALQTGNVATALATANTNKAHLQATSVCEQQGQDYDYAQQSCVAPPLREVKLPLTNSPAACSAANKGLLQVEAATDSVLLCDGSTHVRLVGFKLGSKENPAISCAQLMSQGFPNGDGYYLINDPEAEIICNNGKQSYLPPFEILGQPVHYFPFDSNDYTDFIGSASTAIAPASKVPTFTTGRAGKALKFDRSFVLNCPGVNSAIFRATEWSVAFWLKAPATTADNAVMGQGVRSPNRGLHLVERAESPFFGLFANDVTTPQKALEPNVWGHWVLTMTDRVQKIYLNGVNVATRTATSRYLGTVNNFKIGNNGYTNPPGLTGELDDVIIWSKTLTDEGVEHLYDSYPGPPDTTTSCAYVGNNAWPNGFYLIPAINSVRKTYCVGTVALPKTPPLDVLGRPYVWLAFEGNAKDEAHGRDPTLSGANIVYVPGQNGRAARVLGQSALLFNGNRIPISMFKSDFTLSAWVNMPVVGGSYIIMGAGQALVRKGLYIGVRTGKPILSFHGNDYHVGPTNLVVPNRWTHIVWQYNSLWKKTWVDGKEIGDGARQSTFLGTTDNVQVLKSGLANDQFRGSLDDVMLWPRALSEAEVQLLYQATK